ncbi:hypothetical protein M5K25_005511 [Dendrobium thyrsiflorum]|uniref:Uncharacterized protein n=1 Tax=Dendrobium thyrsiflorum TaxID=117978 RepID=A0ABD0VHP3_DENTH
MATPVSVPPAPFPITNKGEMEPHKEPSAVSAGTGPQSAAVNNVIANTTPQLGVTALHFYPSPSCSPIPKARGRPSNGGETSRGRGRKEKSILSAVGAQLNAYTVIQTGVDATISKPAANVVAEGNATMNVVAGVSNFASIDYKTGQIPGSTAVVEAPGFKASSSPLPEILDNTMSVIVEKDIGDATIVSETESASIGTKLPVTPDQVSVLQQKNPDGVKTDSDYSTAKQTFGSSTPDAFSPKQGQAEKIVDSLQEKTQKTEQNIESTLNDKHTEVGIKDVNSIQMLDNTPTDLHAKSSEMLKPADENRSGICTQMNQETTPSVDVEAFNKLKSVDKSLLRNSKSTTGNSLLANHSSSVGDKAPGNESQSSVSIEAIKFQDNASITGTPMLSSTSMNHEADPIPSCQVQCSPVLDYRAVRVVIHRDSENRASVTRKKAAARETRNRCNTSTAACERRARQAGLKLADGSKKAESRGRTGKATTMKTKQVSGNIEAGPGTSRFKTAQGPDSFLQIETSLEKLKQGNRQIMSSEKAATSAARNFEQTVTKEIKLDQGVTGVSAFDPNKTMSVTSKGNVETNTTSSSNMEGGLVLGLPSLREFPLSKINPLEGKSNMGLPANATSQLTDGRGDNVKSTGIDRLLEEPVTASVTYIRPEGFSEAEVKQLTSVSKSPAPGRNTVPEILEAKITGRSLVKSDAQNSKTYPADLNPTDQEKSGSQSCTKEDCSVTSVLEVDKPVEELEPSHLEKRVIDDSNADNSKAQSVIILPSSCSVTCDENEGKVSVSVENEKDNSSSSSDLVKVMSLENNPVISQKHPPSTALPDSSLIGSKKFAVQEHNASTIMLTVSSELIEHEAQQQAVAASPVFGVNESIDLALEEQHLSAISQTDLKLSEPVEHAAREQDSSTNVQQVLGASASVEHTTEKHNATDSLNGLGFTESVGHAKEKIKASVAYEPLSGVCVSMELYSDDHASASSISGSDNGHGLTNALAVLDVSESIEHSSAEHSATAVCGSVGHEPPEIENRMLTDNDGDNGSRRLSSACTLSNIPRESTDDMECAPGQSLDVLPPEATHIHDKNIQFNQQVDLHVVNCHEENNGEAPVISKIEGSKMHLNTDNIRSGASSTCIETDVLKKVDGVVLALPTESEPLQVHPDTAEIKPVKATTALGLKTRSNSDDKKITEAAREDKATENHTAEVDQSGIETLSSHAYDHAIKHFEETGITQSSNVNQEGLLNLSCGDANPSLSPSSGNEMAASGEDLSTCKASEGSHLVSKSPSAVGVSSAALVQQDSALRSDASCSSPLRETNQNSKVSNSPENSDSTEIKPEVHKVEDSGRLSSAEIKTDGNKDHTSNKVDEDPGS